jgi:hypothetical protein
MAHDHQRGADNHDHHGHGHGGHGHTHGVVDPSITTTGEGLWALKWSFAVLLMTALVQLFIAVL